MIRPGHRFHFNIAITNEIDFCANGEEAMASFTAAKLHKTFAEACKCEDAQCDSIEGRAGCSDTIDVFTQYLAEQKVDAAARAVI